MKHNHLLRIILFGLGIIIAVTVAWMMRENATSSLPVDYDEDDYLRAAQEYALVFQSGDLRGLMDYNYRPEHPPLAKIVYGLAIAPLDPAPLIVDRPTTAGPVQFLPFQQQHNAREAAGILGTLEVALLALVNPVAALMLGLHTFTIKYTSQIMLESLPAFTVLASVLCYIQFKKKGWKPSPSALSPKERGPVAWLAASALFLGLTAASKYLYAVVGFAILLDWLRITGKDRQSLTRWLGWALAWGGLSLLFFFAANPYLWPDPLGRLQESLFFHTQYSTGAAEVNRANFPFWQPFIWLNTGAYMWHPTVFRIYADPFILFLGLFGVSRLWKKEPVFVLWLGVVMFFLLVWPTKWPQYIVTLTAPLSLAAAETLFGLTVEPARRWWESRQGAAQARQRAHRPGDLRRAWAWLIPGLVIFTVFTLFPLVFQLGISLTDFSAASLKDGLQGGLWREIWGGLTGQVQPLTNADPFSRSNTVNYVGPVGYLPVLDFLSRSGLLVFNILWTMLSVGFQTALGVGVALMLWQRGVALKRGWQALFILPWAIPETIGALLWLTVFAPGFGWLALAVKDLGENVPFAFLNGWMGKPDQALAVLLISAVWYGFPFMMLAASAGLKLVPTEVFDAAAIDGANAWQTFWTVTWPLLSPLMLPAIIIRGIFAFNQFYLFQVFGWTLRFDAFTTTIASVSFNIFNPSSGFAGQSGLFALSALLNIVTMLILVFFVALFNRWSKAGEGVTYA